MMLAPSPAAEPTQVSTYTGTERRRHKIYVTCNTEYHFRDELCVAVRSRQSGRWLGQHAVLFQPIAGCVQFLRGGRISPSLGQVQLGQGLYFCVAGKDIITSPLQCIRRPAKHLIERYPTMDNHVSRC